MSGSQTKPLFPGRDEDFMSFMEQFEARMYGAKLHKVLNGTITGTADQKEELWYELVQCLDKKSIMLIRSKKGDGAETWKVLKSRFKSSERPRIQNLFTNLINISMGQNETVVDYLSRAEDYQLNLSENNESISDEMFKSIILKGLPSRFENFVTLVNFSTDVKTYDEVKRDLINFETSRSEKQN